ncbi:hydrogenase subunit MbhD domain-containing protein [Streptomyces sp. NPDC093225]|uniref:hydrogenase subunit MbhD domain-containing protein n=1 Tax=Streptomyces sp. NPDC093225 TaxID=3366034 RepID=UPI00380E480A
MTEALVLLAVLLVAATGTVAVLTREPVRQAVVLGVLGLLLALLFTLVQAPDVALSQLAVGSVMTPLLILLTVRAVRRATADAPAEGGGGRAGEGRGR